MAADPPRSAKDRLLARVYYDVREGFGSIAQTLRKARELDPSVTREEVLRFLNRQEVRQRKNCLLYTSDAADELTR